MTTTVELFRSGAWEAIDYESFSIDIGLSPQLIAPEASVTTTVNEPVNAGQPARIVIDGTTRFQGRTVSGGVKRYDGTRKVDLEHEAVELFNAATDVDLLVPSDFTVLSQAITNADTDATFDLQFNATSIQLNDDYQVQNRTVKAIFRDMMDRGDNIWWVDPVTNDIYVEPRTARGGWQALDAATDGVVVQQFDSGSADTVINDVTVVGTAGQRVEGSASNQTSIDEYGRRTATVNVGYVQSATEATEIAQALLQPDPVPEGKLLVPETVGGVAAPQVNKTLDYANAAKNIDVDGILIERQKIEQGRATLWIGGGVGESVASHNRKQKSSGDVTAPGSVYGSDRIASGAIDSEQLVNSAVIESKLDNLSVSLQKLQDGAVSEQKLQDLAVSLQKVQDGAISETKILDNSISTPKLQAEAVTAAKILAGTITANEIAADTLTANEIAAATITASEIAADTITANEIVAGTITALEIAADTLTANEIDTLDLDTAQLSVTEGGDGIEFTSGSAFGGVTYSAMIPTGNGISQIGLDTQRFGGGYFNQLFTGGLTVGTNVTTGVSDGEAAFLPADALESWLIDTPDNSNPALRPSADLFGFIGTGDGTSPTNAVAEIHTHNFYEYSPAPVASDRSPGPNEIDRAELRASSWDDPPAYVSQRKVATERDPETGEPLDTSHEPAPEGAVELGALANYLLEVCKTQDRLLEDQADRIDDLEQRLSRLEKQV